MREILRGAKTASWHNKRAGREILLNLILGTLIENLLKSVTKSFP